MENNQSGWHFEEGEILLINKPLTWTSFNAVAKLKAILRHRFHLKKIKIGHAGTLDPLATGLLIVCTGKYTKKIEEIQALPKVYTGTFVLGTGTPSYDLETTVNETMPIDHLSDEQIQSAAKQFIGEQMQVPPVFSAVKINGKRAYEYARTNTEVEIKPKNIHIYQFEITGIALPEVDFRITCSKGTYIRSIARDFGRKLDTVAHLSKLCREQIGDYTLRDALDITSDEWIEHKK